ncbi:MAG: hypothetical protein Q9169_007512 [Polycauliona sp. 2 TL-2023]
MYLSTYLLLTFLLTPSLTSTALTTLNFDTIPTPHGLAPLHSHKNLTFTQTSIFNPLSPSLRYIITPNDHNCAVSAPNAIIGSRNVEGERGMSFSVSNDDDGRKFALKQFWVKPMDFPEGGDVRVIVRGYRSGDTTSSKPLIWHIDFPAGYHLPFLVKMDEYSNDDWTGLGSVEIVADYGEQKLDWEVCLDDLVVEFVDGVVKMDDGGGRVGDGQFVLGDLG